MAILVDELREYPGVALPFTRWCHMTTDGAFEELHAFAGRLGLRRGWFQADHYDLPPHGRARAVALGAEEVETRELLERMTGPRGDRARRRARTPRGTLRLRGDDGPRVLRYPRGDLVVVAGGGPEALAAAVQAAGVPVVGLSAGDAAIDAALAAGRGAIAPAPTAACDRLAALAAGHGRAAHLIVLGDVAPAERLASVTVLDRAAAERLRRIAFS